ncbi:MAG: molybdopterin biosynthesis protein [Anaerolineaceae bacterium]|nr:molybdopterin biosynthesis protein [Anaerolineaceae bacterium]
MGVYLKDIPLDEAINRFYKALGENGLRGVLGVETIPLDEQAVGRVLAEPVWAKISSPHYHASAMDGFALKAIDTQEAMATNPIYLVVGEQAVYVDTGDPMPDWANAVIPIENIEPLDENGKLSLNPRDPYQIRIRESKTPWSHVRPMGEDIIATELVLPSGKRLLPVDLGAAAACGHTQLKVSRKPLVTILPTGTELISIGESVQKGDIIEYNSIVLGAQVLDWGGISKRYSITADLFEKIKNNVLAASNEADLILLNAGSSAGSEDYSADVIEALGEVFVHGIAVRPGHPVILGMVTNDFNRQVPIIGIPGYPVSAALTGEIFVRPLLAEWLGQTHNQPEIITASLTRKLNSPAGDDDYVRVVTGKVGDKYLAAPLTRGAGVITSLVRADGYAVIPRGVQGKLAGEKIKVHLIKKTSEIKNTVFAIGSHDMTLDLLADYLSHKERRLISSNVGSLAGLIAINRGEAHFGGSHLLDPETGEYNISYVQKYVKDIQVKIFTWVSREQGLIINKGNPKSVESISDLARDDVRFINRQRGSGTRILFDYLLSNNQLMPASINGYDSEEYTHLSIAAAVASGRADVGMGVAAAAQALELDFLPLMQERYDLIIPERFIDEGLFDPIFKAMKDVQFRNIVQSLPGYDVSLMGNQVIKS